MSSIRSQALPPDALLARYAHAGAFTDCYATEIAGSFSQAEYVEAFYTTAVFRLERQLLAWFVASPSSAAQARQLATGELDSFAAWRVEERSADQLLVTDFAGRTRSWLMVVSNPVGGTPTTRLYFGSAVVPIVSAASGRPTMGVVFRALLGFHRIYSRVLLGAARSRLARARHTPG